MKKKTKTTHHEKVAEHAESLLVVTAHIADKKIAEARKKLQAALEQASGVMEVLEETAKKNAKKADTYLRDMAKRK